MTATIRSPVSGFTIIELMITVVLVGLLSALAVPRLGNVKENGYVTAMQSDLRNLAQSQESYFYDNAVYTPDLGVLNAIGYQVTSTVSVTIVEATASGWSASASHTTTNKQCGVFVGTAAPVGAAGEEGEIACQ